MVSLVLVFYIFVILFALVGTVRGWAKELVVTFSVILSLFLIAVMENYVPWVKDMLPTLPLRTGFWVRALILILLAFFGYQTPATFERLAAKTTKSSERVQDWMLGLFLGGINGYLVIGSIWYFMIQAGYPFESISAPGGEDPFYNAAQILAGILPPAWLGVPQIYFAVGLAFVFVIIVFL